jgi:hypothetical protein
VSAQEVLEQYLVASFGDREGKIVAGEIRDTLRAAGYVVVKVPRVTVPTDDTYTIEERWYCEGWNACRTAMLSAAEGDAP